MLEDVDAIADKFMGVRRGPRWRDHNKSKRSLPSPSALILDLFIFLLAKGCLQ